MDENTPKTGEDDDSYVIEDTGSSIEEIEREMHEAAKEAVQATETPDDASSASSDLREQNRALQDRVLRTLADFENFRKRSEREKQDFFKYALGNTPQHRNMGRWSDGTPIIPLKIQDAAPIRP